MACVIDLLGYARRHIENCLRYLVHLNMGGSVSGYTSMLLRKAGLVGVSVTAMGVAVYVTGILLLTVGAGFAYWVQSRQIPAIPTIAFIPQSAGSMLGEVEYFGARVAAERVKFHLYWSAPTSENDMPGQVSLIDKVGRGKYQGLVLAPNHTLGIRAPLRRALAAGLPVVIIASQLDIPASSKFGYIVNDDEKMGELAAGEIARLIHGKGSIALVGLARFTPGVARRLRGAERLLASQFPKIRVVSRVGGANSTPRAEALTKGAIDSHPGLNAILSFTAASTRGVHSALKSRSLQDRDTSRRL
jgi:ABC-type sugar transport system substrate-binding protein